MNFKSIMTTGFLLVAATANLAGAPCNTATLNQYMANFPTGCTIGNDYQFSNFSYVGVNVFANNVNPSNITVTPGLNAQGPTLTFSADWRAAGLVSVSEGLIAFSVDSITPGFKVSQVSLGVTGSVTPGPLGLPLGTATVAEVICFGGLLNLGQPSVACLGGGVGAAANAVLPTGANVNANALIALNPHVTHLDVIKDITLAGILNSASISSITQGFTSQFDASAVPEPATMILVGFALLLVGFSRFYMPRSLRLAPVAAGADRSSYRLGDPLSSCSRQSKPEPEEKAGVVVEVRDSSNFNCTGSIRHFSDNRIELFVDQALLWGEILRLRVADALFVGVVRRVSFRQNGFIVDIEILEGEQNGN